MTQFIALTVLRTVSRFPVESYGLALPICRPFISVSCLMFWTHCQYWTEQVRVGPSLSGPSLRGNDFTDVGGGSVTHGRDVEGCCFHAWLVQGLTMHACGIY